MSQITVADTIATLRATIAGYDTVANAQSMRLAPQWIAQCQGVALYRDERGGAHRAPLGTCTRFDSEEEAHAFASKVVNGNGINGTAQTLCEFATNARNVLAEALRHMEVFD
jgi:hypothetical protein